MAIEAFATQHQGLVCAWQEVAAAAVASTSMNAHLCQRYQPHRHSKLPHIELSTST
jgi:hypothetical protein